MATVLETLDPLQGFDVKVEVMGTAEDTQGAGTSSGRLVGAFTSLMFKVINQTETYLPLNQRMPRMLDGEVIIVWSLEQGLVDLNIIRNTYGSAFETALAAGRGASVIPRQTRFKIKFSTAINASDIASMPQGDAQFNQDSARAGSSGAVWALNYCRVDTCTFGVAAGRHVVANTWQGTAQNLIQLTAATGTGTGG